MRMCHGDCSTGGVRPLNTQTEMNRFFISFIMAIVLWGLPMHCSSSATTVRQPAVAGSFYPADSTELQQLIESQLAGITIDSTLDGYPIALIVPHAGYVYSGPVPAYCYKLLARYPIKNVVLCGPSHRVPFDGLSVAGPGIAWQTPLGQVHCSDSLCKRIIKSAKQISTDPTLQAQEHSLEVQLPFLQTVLRNFEIVPIEMGSQDVATIDRLTSALTSLPTDSTTILIASSDWQHYRPASTGHRMDSIGVSCLERLDPDG